MAIIVERERFNNVTTDTHTHTHSRYSLVHTCWYKKRRSANHKSRQSADVGVDLLARLIS